MMGLLPLNCVLATTFVQTSHGQSAAWGFDERLFYHLKQSRLSQVAFLLHERLYLKARTEKNATDSYYVTQLVGKILDADTTFAQLFSDYMKIDSHNQLGDDAVDEIDWAPLKLLTHMHYALASQMQAGGKSEAQVAYFSDF